MVQSQMGTGEALAAILAGIVITRENIGARKTDDLLFSLEWDIGQESEDGRDFDGQSDGVNLLFRFLDDLDFALE